MNELIKIKRRNIGDGEIPTVNARELHGFLGSKRQFSNWIIYQINAFRFIEGVDFIKLNNFVNIMGFILALLSSVHIVGHSFYIIKKVYKFNIENYDDKINIIFI